MARSLLASLSLGGSVGVAVAADVAQPSPASVDEAPERAAGAGSIRNLLTVTR